MNALAQQYVENAKRQSISDFIEYDPQILLKNDIHK